MRNNSKELIKNCLNSNEIKEELENLKLRMNEENTSLQDTIDDLSKICINISDKSFDKIPFSSDSRAKKKRKFQ